MILNRHDPESVLTARKDILRWLHTTAPTEWRYIHAQGTKFLAPAELNHLHGDALLDALIAAETQRIRAAALFHADADLVRSAVAQVAHQDTRDVLRPQDLPAPTGLMVCGDSLSQTQEGTAVIAVNWQSRSDGHLWVNWWSDAEAAARRRVQATRMTQATARQWLGQRGGLAYERERLLPFVGGPEDPLAIPAAFDDSQAEPGMDAIVRSMTRITIAVLRLIADGTAQTSTLTTTPSLSRKLHAAGLASTVCAATLPAPTADHPHTHAVPSEATHIDPAHAQRLIAQHIAATLPGRAYPAALPPELAAWYCYPADAGHSIAVAVKALYTPGGDPATFLVPAPVKAVQRAGWTVQDGFVVSALGYDPMLGLETDPHDDEF